MFKQRPKPVLLIILDGWGVAAPSATNAITVAKTPNLDSYLEEYPVVNLAASGLAVGLPEGVIGSSEVGHLTIGSGQVIKQSLPLINQAIEDQTFYANEQLLAAINWSQKNNSQLHLMGLLSDGGVHSSQEHLYALLEMCKKNNLTKVFVHAFLDGRDTPYNSGIDYLQKLQAKMTEIGCGQIASVCGRYYAMDRDNHWERISIAYQALTKGESKYLVTDPIVALNESYQRGVYDEECEPILVINNENKPLALVQDNDAIIYFNYRPDRGRELTKAFTLPTFPLLANRKFCANLYFVTMTQYEKDIPAHVAFNTQQEFVSLTKVLSQAGLKQLHVAETEKYVHVTYFFNGREEQPASGEERILIPSPRVASYDQEPRMGADEITKQVLAAINKEEFDFILVNYANADMVGHTGKFSAIVTAIDCLDENVGQLVEETLKLDGLVMITADHGNAEQTYDLERQQISKEHSLNLVPCYVISNELKGKTIYQGLKRDNLHTFKQAGQLADIAPTILKIMGLKKPEQMSGQSLI